jgi:hypothetical protein
VPGTQATTKLKSSLKKSSERLWDYEKKRKKVASSGNNAIVINAGAGVHREDVRGSVHTRPGNNGQEPPGPCFHKTNQRVEQR